MAENYIRIKLAHRSRWLIIPRAYLQVVFVSEATFQEIGACRRIAGAPHRHASGIVAQHDEVCMDIQGRGARLPPAEP